MLQLGLQLFEGDTFCLRIGEKYDEELQDGHAGEEEERSAARKMRDGDGEQHCDDGVADPMGSGSEALALGADAVGEDLRDVPPDDGALGECEETDEDDEQPDDAALVDSGVKDHRRHEETDEGADGADEQKYFATEFVDEQHADGCADEVGEPNVYGLGECRQAAESGSGKDLVGIVEDGIYAGELVEESDADREENWKGRERWNSGSEV